MKRGLSFSGALLLVVLIANTFALPLPAAEVRRLVLVAGNTSPAVSLSQEEVRKLYLGVPVTKDGKTFLPLCNHTDKLAYEIFLQKVVFMSGPTYERALMSRLVRAASSFRPPEYATEQELLQAIASTPNTLTYMWADKAEAAGLRIVMELWREKE